MVDESKNAPNSVYYFWYLKIELQIVQTQLSSLPT